MIRWSFAFWIALSGMSLYAKTGPCVSTTLGADFVHGMRTDIANKIGISKNRPLKSTGAVGMIAGGYEWSFYVPFARVEGYIGRDSAVDQTVSATLSNGDVVESHLRKGWIMGVSASGGMSLLFLTPYLKIGWGANQIRHTFREINASGELMYQRKRNAIRWSPFFAAGFRESLFGLIFYIEYAYSSVPTVSQVTYNDKVWKSTQEADLMGVHMVTLGLSYIF